MKYNIKSFWKGSVMSDMTLNTTEYSKLKKQLELDFFAGGDNSQELIEYLDYKEGELCKEYQLKGKYELELREMALHLVGINALIKKGLVPNDDNYGLVIMKYKK